MGRKAEIIKRAIEEKLGEKNVRVWYVPIHGPCMEMQGYAGGWYWSSDDVGEDVLGYNVQEALESIETTRQLRAMGHYSRGNYNISARSGGGEG